MKKAQNVVSNVKKCTSIIEKKSDDLGEIKINNIKSSNKINNGDNRSNNSFYELFLSLIWCFVFLFYCELCLSDGHGETHHYSNYRSMSSEAKLAGYGDSHLDNATVGNAEDSMLLEVNISINVNISTIQGLGSSNSSCSLSRYEGMEELVFHILRLGQNTLVCKIPCRTEDHSMNKLEDHQHGMGLDSSYLKQDESRNKALLGKAVISSSEQVNVTHRLEPDGTPYNFASAAKGAKVVAHNKEAKGASNILGKDHDKYLINPCSVSDKFVVVQLAEETLVDSVKIANFEHYSSNFKEFELQGSLTYPTDEWSFMGKFVAANSKHGQTFVLPEPKWVTYLNLSLISHYGSEHYCTLNVLEVYGVDAIERMLEDLMVTSGRSPVDHSSKINTTEVSSVKPQDVTGSGKNGSEVLISSDSAGKGVGTADEQKASIDATKTSGTSSKVPDPVVGKSTSRIPGDSVLKILMQKVRSVEMNLSVLEEYLKELNKKQADIIPEINKEISKVASLLDSERKDIEELVEWKEETDKQIDDIELWKVVVSSQVDELISENRNLRSLVENIENDQASLQNKELAVLLVSFFFLCIAFLKLVSKRVLLSFGASRGNHVSKTNKGWLLILFSSGITMLITLI